MQALIAEVGLQLVVSSTNPNPPPPQGAGVTVDESTVKVLIGQDCPLKLELKLTKNIESKRVSILTFNLYISES